MLCELTDKAFRTRLETGSLSIKAPKISPQDTDCADVAVESIEQCKVESNLDLDSTTVKEEYLFKDELEESSNIIESIDPQIQNCSETRLKDDCDSSGCGGTGLDDNGLLDVVDEEKLDETSNIENYLDGERRLIDSGEQNIKVNKKVKKRKIDKTYTCPVCSASCTGFAQFKVHKKTHGKYCYQCSICDKKFAAITTRKLHVESVHTDMKVSCELCSKQFSNSATLHTHIRRYHENRTKQHVCTVCNKSFLTKSNWKAHMETHGTERKYACDECPTTFKTASGLNAHKQTHKPREESTRHRSRLFICEHCGKQSSSQPTHLNHLKTHMDAKPFVCSVCQKCFRAKITLDQHMLLHTGEKPFSCNLCGMSFRQAAHLRTHLRSIHEQARPHICQWCERAFTSASNLKAHTRIHTGETPFECNFCPLRFTTSKNLKRHRLKEHANDISDIKVVPSATNDDDDSSVAEIIEVEMDKSSIEKDDLLPKQICYSCENQLEMAHEFRMLCESTDKTLRARLVPQNRYIDSAFASVEPIEQYIVESKLDLDSIIVKEEYMTDDELEENVIESVDPLVTSRNEISLKEDYGSRSSEGTVLDKVDEEKFDQTSIIENPVDEHLRPIDCVEQDVKSCVRVKRKWVRREKEKIIKTFTCPVCAASFTDFPKFNAHKKTHGKYRYECPMCDRKFARTTVRNLHVASVHSSTQVPCDVCGKQLASTVTLRNHIRECHGNKEKRHVCKICNKRFYRKANMRMHMNIHGDERNYACDKCPSTYKTACSLHVHKLTHKPPEERIERRKRQQNQKKPKHRLFICEHCGKQTWSHPRHLIHLRIHTGEKPYACDVCQKTFAQKPALNSHMRCHTGERPHSCHLCGMSFRQGPHLQTHIRSIHEQARPHKCQACGKAFTSAGNLRTHVRLHTGEKPFECNLCPLRFIDINGLKRHRRKEHANDIAPKKAMPSSTNDDEVLSLSALVEVVEEELDESC